MASNGKFRESHSQGIVAKAKATVTVIKAVKTKATNAAKMKHPNTSNKCKGKGTSKGKAEGRFQGKARPSESVEDLEVLSTENALELEWLSSESEEDLEASSDDAELGDIVVRCGRCSCPFYKGDPELDSVNFRDQPGFGDCCPSCSMDLGNFTGA